MVFPNIWSSQKSPTPFVFLHKQKSNFDSPVLTDDYTAFFQISNWNLHIKKNFVWDQNKLQDEINIIM